MYLNFDVRFKQGYLKLYRSQELEPGTWMGSCKCQCYDWILVFPQKLMHVTMQEGLDIKLLGYESLSYSVH